MLNFANLNDMEFEALCRDILERKLGIPLRRFAVGRDGGVDLADDVQDLCVMVQVRHYLKSNVSTLIRSLKKELPKVAERNPKRYYICCSRELSPDRVRELYCHFRDYMDSDRQIITLPEIDDFLKAPENKDILQKHFKLWIDATGILEELCNDAVFVDCEAFLADIHELHKLFVRTAAFDQALNVLSQNRTLCIIGDPGVGKSITCKMLVLHYAAQGYRVRCTTDVAELTALKASLRREPDTKEVILLDDCFGQAYFEMKSSQSSELLSLIKYVKLRPGKILILNSRVTIFQEARQRRQELLRSLEREEYRVFLLDLNSLSLPKKAKILYNHLVFSGIPREYFDALKPRFQHIITHPNYSPRIMEFVCSPSRWRQIPADQFCDYIICQLENPSQMWKEEYEHRLQAVDRILLQTVYSTTTTSIRTEYLRQCFDWRIAKDPTIDKTIDQFSNALTRLSEGFLTILDHHNHQTVAMKNPSINDFLRNRLQAYPLEYQELLQGICSTAQILILLPKEDRISFAVRALETGSIDQFVFPSPRHKEGFVCWCILAGKLLLPKYRQIFLGAWPSPSFFRFCHTFSDSPFPSSYISPLYNLLLPEIWEFYDLKAFFLKPGSLDALLHPVGLVNAARFLSRLDTCFPKEERSTYLHLARRFLQNEIADFCNPDIADYEHMLPLDEVLPACRSGSSEDIAEATYALEWEVTAYILFTLERLRGFLPESLALSASGFTESDICVHGAQSLITEYLASQESMVIPEEKREIPSAIDNLFLR